MKYNLERQSAVIWGGSRQFVSCVQFIGVEVFCAETVMNPMQLYPQDNVNVLPPADEIKFLLTLRLVNWTELNFIVV